MNRFGRSPTSVLPMTEPGPGSGGAQRQKSSTEFTGTQRASVNSRDAPNCFVGRRTIRILASRVLVASGATLVCAGLALLGVIGKIVRRVGRSVCLGVDAQDG